jgi:signal transduction histidine kinase
MRIESGFHLGSVIGGIILTAAILSFGYSQAHISSAVHQNAILDRISTEGMQLVQLTNEVLLYREERATQQWWAQYHEVMELLKERNPPVRGRSWVILGRIATHLTDMQLLFERFAPPAGAPESATPHDDGKGILSSQLFQKAALLQSSLSNLNADSQKELADGHQEANERVVLTFGLFVVLISLFALVALLLFRRRVLLPLQNLETSIQRVKRDSTHRATVFARDEIGVVCEAFNNLISDLQRTQDTLKLLNETLERRVQEALDKNREKDHLLIQQSRLAAMGEMIHNIAHQWRQPINALTLLLANIKDAYDFNELTKDHLDEEVKAGQQLIQHMSRTIDDFRNFFRPEQGKVVFALQKPLDSACNLVAAALKNNNITLSVLLDDGVLVSGHPNEFAQVIVNLITNAKEAILEQKSRHGHIRVAIGQENGTAWMSVSDNGGGVPENILDKVFDPYFTTKGAKGSGIGLYMSKMILDKMDGAIRIRNSEDGVEVRITLPLARSPGD